MSRARTKPASTLDRLKAGLIGTAPRLSGLIAAADRPRADSAPGNGRPKPDAERKAVAERKKIVRLERELAAARQRLKESQDEARQQQGELARRAEAAEAALSDLRHRMAQTESALAQRRHEADETAADLAAIREDLRRTVMSRDKAEKVSAGLKEHVVLLKEEVASYRTAIADLQQTHKTELANKDRAFNALAKRAKEVLVVLDTSRQALSARLDVQVHETARATRLAEDTAVAANHAVASLLQAHGGRLTWDSLRLKRRASLVQRSGVFDAEWYVDHYGDVAAAEMDPLRHYVERGASEGRAPNPALAHSNGKRRDQVPLRRRTRGR